MTRHQWHDLSYKETRNIWWLVIGCVKGVRIDAQGNKEKAVKNDWGMIEQSKDWTNK